MKNGFSLIELLVAISIIVILTSILVANFPKGREQFVLQRVAHKLIQDLRRVQEMSMSAREEICPSSQKANGFGVHFNQSSPNSYLLFANCDEFYSYDAISDDKILENIDMERGTEIFNLSPGPLCSITFVPPSPTTYINDFIGIESQIIISLESDTSKIKVIKVNKTGLIEIQ